MTRDIPDLVAVGSGNAMAFLPRYVYDAGTAANASPPGLFDTADSSPEGR